MADVQATSKAKLRIDALALRRAVSNEVRLGFSKRLATVGAGLVRSEDHPFDDPVVSLFLPIRDEPDTHPLIDVLGKIGLTTALPITITRGQPLNFRAWKSGDPLDAGPWGTSHPQADAPLVDPDVLFVPLAAFDRRGARIGYGAGYYDATLATLRRKKGIRAIGVAFACQEMFYIPTEPHDEPLDLVLTEREIVICEL